VKKHKKYKRGYNYHHRRPRSRGGGGGRNISHVSASLHDLWHRMFGNMIATEVAKALENVWLEDGFRVVIVQKDEEVTITKRKPPFSENPHQFGKKEGFVPP